MTSLLTKLGEALKTNSRAFLIKTAQRHSAIEVAEVMINTAAVNRLSRRYPI